MDALRHQGDALSREIDALFTTRRLPRVRPGVLAARCLVAWCTLVLLLVALRSGDDLIGASVVSPRVASFIVVSAVFAVIAACVQLGRYPTLWLMAGASVGAAVASGFVEMDRPLIAAPIMIITATFTGFAIARGVTRVAWIVPLIIAASISDVRSVYFGTTRAMMDAAGFSGPSSTGVSVDAIHGVPGLLLMRFPVWHGLLVLGAVDVTFAALLIGLAWRFRLPLTRTCVALALGYAYVVVIGGTMPVIPFLCSAFLIANAQAVGDAVRYWLQRSATPWSS